jgi:hypothetical protein
MVSSIINWFQNIKTRANLPRARATASTVKEATELIELGYEFVVEIEGLKLFRKLKI